jgi:uncharacterized protein YyaL (SSP411 family)
MEQRSPQASQNRLAQEKSPYLLQHAKNPVDWYPWGEEAFLRAAREDKPVFLSIGYATCHWCHVMAHESFEDAEVAELLNRDFVCIKVDREERPDIDSTYMRVCQMMTGQGGWPLTVILAPDKRPFFAATYIPKERRFSVPGLIELLPRIARAWREQRTDLLQSANRIAGALSNMGAGSPGPDPDATLLDEGYEELVLQFDPEYGGFGSAPKFPTPHILLFLLRYGARTGKRRALDMATKTLDAMQDGGIFDHVGGGFHRYATDAQWRIPHFEKMLYDQALLLMAYTEAFQATGQERYKRTADAIASYVMRDLTSPEGAFLSAEDADSPGGEGAYYLWTGEELAAVLGDADAALASRVFSVSPQGNFSGSGTGRLENILYRSRPLEEIAAATGVGVTELEGLLALVQQRLFAARKNRPRPSLDDKVLADWNGLMIAALAKASWVFGNAEYLAAAERAMAFLLANLRTSQGRLWHRYRDSEPAIPAFADDYAFVILALLELYGDTFDVRYLSEALALNTVFREHFLDPDHGGFYSVPDDAEVLFSRKHEVYDGAVPSANSVSCENLLRLFSLTGDPAHAGDASALARRFGTVVREHPSAYGWFLCAIDRATGDSPDILIVGDTGPPDTRHLIAAARATYRPGTSVLFRSSSDPEQAAALSAVASFTQDREKTGGVATAYICQGNTCSLPVTSAEQLTALISRKKRDD